MTNLKSLVKTVVLTMGIATLASCQQTAGSQQANLAGVNDAVYENVPFDMPKVKQPVFPD